MTEGAASRIEFRPSESEVGERVDLALTRRLSVPRTLVQRALKEGLVTVSGEAVRPSYRLEPGDTVAGDVPARAGGPPLAEDIPIAVRYSDDRVLVVSKPAGLVTHPARGHDRGTLVNALLALGEPLAGRGSIRPGIVHRLDKDTSGLLLVAKDDRAQAELVEALRRREVERRYLALIKGAPAAERSTVDAPVGRDPRRRWRMAVVPDGRPSVTHLQAIASADGFTLLEVKLETGRTHQIRVHLAHLGHPVLGDRTYGGASEAARALGLTRPFLHAHRLSFPLPGSGHRIEVADPLPPDLADALARAGLSV